ncbi:hypothetical protein AAFC00_005777 [Neodothiora populina]|uniref:CENP-V/GFA domain-containing protein n=1 Tax=Neodothiora populina TaxID=2781224 RepID=A0ABR3P753_9PEZI
MAKGSCLCGDFAYEYEGEPAAKAACHCKPCQKTSGTTNSFNLMVPEDKFYKKSGKVKQFTRKGVSGNDVTYNMCDNCGTLVFAEAGAIPGIKIVKLGTLDDADVLNGIGHANLEIFTKDRLSWLQPIPGAEQKEMS